jgi:uncharacterized protein YkwD
MTRAAKDLCDAHAKGSSGHTTPDGRDTHDRFERYGVAKGKTGENITYGVSEPKEIVIQMLIDDGGITN